MTETNGKIRFASVSVAKESSKSVTSPKVRIRGKSYIKKSKSECNFKSSQPSINQTIKQTNTFNRQ